MEWYTLAARLGMPIQQCQALTTSTEFLEWREFFRRELERPRREDYYAAQIAAEVRRTIAKKPEAVKLEHFVLGFEAKSNGPVDEEAERAVRLANSKAAWLAIAQGVPKR